MLQCYIQAGKKKNKPKQKTKTITWAWVTTAYAARVTAIKINGMLPE